MKIVLKNINLFFRILNLPFILFRHLIWILPWSYIYNTFLLQLIYKIFNYLFTLNNIHYITFMYFIRIGNIIKKKNIIKYNTLAIFWAYCFIANFSIEFSNPKKFLISRLAVCSKHVHSEFSGWTYNHIKLILFQYSFLQFTLN